MSDRCVELSQPEVPASLSEIEHSARLRAPGQATGGVTALTFTMLRVGVLLAIAAVGSAYFATYQQYIHTPGNDPQHPLGWWGWFDQSEYLKSSRALLNLNFSSSEYFYPPLYPLTGSLLLWASDEHSYFLTNMAFALGFAAVFVKLMGRYVGYLSAAVCVIAAMVGLSIFRLQWVIPWTSSLSAMLIVGAYYLLDRFIRLRDTDNWGWLPAHTNASLFGLAVGLVLPTRPVDLALVAPAAGAYAILVLTAIARGPAQRRQVATRMAARGALSIVPGFLLFFGFNLAVHKSLFGAYFSLVDSNGYDIADFIPKLFSHLLSSQIFYAEAGQDWLSQIPLVFALVLVLPAMLFVGPLVMRLIAGAVLLQFVVYYSYSDIVPTGTFRYFNIHYFKWMVPFAAAMALYLLRGATLRGEGLGLASRRTHVAALGASGLLGIFAICLTADYDVQPVKVLQQSGNTVALEPTGAGVKIIDLPGVNGDALFYLSQRAEVSLNGATSLRAPKDFRVLPMVGGTRILFTRPVAAKAIDVKIGEGGTMTEPLSESNVRGLNVNFTLGAPFSQTRHPGRTKPGYRFGDVIEFTTTGNAQRFMLPGGWWLEPWGTWIADDQARLELDVGGPPAEDVELHLSVGGFLFGTQVESRGEVVVNGRVIGELKFTEAGLTDRVLTIPREVFGETGDLVIEMRNLNPVSPIEAGAGGSDTRRLGLSISKLSIVEAPPAAVSPIP